MDKDGTGRGGTIVIAVCGQQPLFSVARSGARGGVRWCTVVYSGIRWCTMVYCSWLHTCQYCGYDAHCGCLAEGDIGRPMDRACAAIRPVLYSAVQKILCAAAYTVLH